MYYLYFFRSLFKGIAYADAEYCWMMQTAHTKDGYMEIYPQCVFYLHIFKMDIFYWQHISYILTLNTIK